MLVVPSSWWSSSLPWWPVVWHVPHCAWKIVPTRVVIPVVDGGGPVVGAVPLYNVGRHTFPIPSYCDVSFLVAVRTCTLVRIEIVPIPVSEWVVMRMLMKHHSASVVKCETAFVAKRFGIIWTNLSSDNILSMFDGYTSQCLDSHVQWRGNLRLDTNCGTHLHH